MWDMSCLWYVYCPPQRYSFSHAITHSITHLFAHKLSHSLTHLHAHSWTTHALIHSLVRLQNYSLTHALSYSLINSSCTHSLLLITHACSQRIFFTPLSSTFLQKFIFLSCVCVLVRMCLQVFASVLDCTANTLTLKTDHIAFVVNYVSFIPSMETDAHPRSPIEFLCNTTALVSGL